MEQLFRAHWPLVCGYLLRQVRDRELAEDLAQETFVKAARSITGWRGDSAAGWLLSIARSVLIDDARKARRNVPAVYDAQLPPLVEAGYDAVLVRDVLGRLSTFHCRLLTLVYIDGFSLVEVAAMTGRSEGSIKTAVWRARAAFVATYGEHS